MCNSFLYIFLRAAFIVFFPVIFALLLAISANSAEISGNTTNDSFSKVKKMLDREVYTTYRKTIYCNADFNRDRLITLPRGFVATSHPKRAMKVEWEHAVPAENFGRAFSEWRDGHPECVHKGKPFKGRNCAEKVNMEYRYMQADMHNLFPAIGAINAARSNFQYSELPDEPTSFGVCNVKISGKRFEPPVHAKGQLARAALYMDAAYPKYRLSDQQKRLFSVWDEKYSPDAWECERSRRIKKLQGNGNPFIDRKCGN